MADLDGDGIPEVAIQSEFSTQAANSEGLIWIARSGGNPEGQWQAEVIDRVPTSHYLVFADLDGDGELELVNAPLVGPGQELVSLFWYGQGRLETWPSWPTRTFRGSSTASCASIGTAVIVMRSWP